MGTSLSGGGGSSSNVSSGGYRYSGRGGSKPVVASALALSWSDEAPGWKDVPLPALPPASVAAAKAARTAVAAPPAAAKPVAAARAAPAAAPPPPSSTRVDLSAPPGQDLNFLSPAPLACRSSGVAGTSTSGRPPSDAASRLLIFPTTSSLSYLDGTLPGDYGFDPLGLFDPSNGSVGFMSQRWLHTAEVVHGRWAMLGAAGCLAPEYLAHERVIPKATGLLWFKTGFLPPASAGFDYGLDLGVLFTLQMALMGAAEGLRLVEYNNPGWLRNQQLLGLERLIGTTQIGSAAYPGGLPFNPLGLGKRPAVMREYQQAEIRHGRLAMLACLGYAAQALVTGRGPYDNWNQHLVEPDRYNMLTLLGEILAPST